MGRLLSPQGNTKSRSTLKIRGGGSQRLAALLLSLLMLSTPVLAVDTGVTPNTSPNTDPDTSPNTSAAVLTTEQPTFSVITPAILPVDIDQYGNIVVATDVMVTNNSNGPIKIKDITIEEQNGWQLKESSVTEKAKAKEFTLDIDVASRSIPAKASTNIIYSSLVSPQTSYIQEAMGLVCFIVGWDLTDDLGPEEEPIPEGDLFIDGQPIIALAETSPMVAVSSGDIAIKNWASADPSIASVSFNSSNSKRAIVTAKSIGTTEIKTVDINGLEGTKQIEVRELGLKSIAMTKRPNKTSYNLGEYFDTAGMIVTANYTDGTRVNVRGYTYDTTQINHGQTSIPIEYTEKGVTVTAECQISVNEDNANINYVMATDNDFYGDGQNQWRYCGTKEYIQVPYAIRGTPVQEIGHMFGQSDVIKGVSCYNTYLVNITGAFNNITSEVLILDKFNFYNVSQASSAFQGCKSKVIDLGTRDWNLFSAGNAGVMWLVCEAETVYVPNTKLAAEFRKTYACPSTIKFIVKPA